MHDHDGDGSAPQVASLLSALSAYVPRDRLHAISLGRALPVRATGSALVADISGFTPLTEALARELGPRRSGEELTRHLNSVYGALIAAVSRFRGSVIGFSGDAITCWFDDDDGLRAAACGLQQQQAIQQFHSIVTPSGRTLSLAIKVAVAKGAVRRGLVGDAEIQVLDVMTGSVVDRITVGEGLAEPGEVLVGEEIATAAADRMSVSAWRTQFRDRFAVVNAVSSADEPAPWPPLDLATIDEQQLRPWMIPAVYRQLQSGQTDFLAELRSAVALFLRFGGLDFEADDDVVAKLDAYVRWTQRVVARYEGALIQLTTGDKGSYLYAAFGAPSAHEKAVECALSAASVLRAPPRELAFITSTQIGLSVGRMRTGAYGSEHRRTYGVLGDDANVAARLMMKALPGQILASKAIVDTATGSRFDPLGMVELKGKQPIHHFALRSAEELVGRESRGRRSRDPMVGRAHERDLLERLVDQIHNGRADNLAVIIEGEAGIGKSRLLGALLDHARTKLDPRITCLITRTDAVERSTSYYAWRRIFARLLGVELHNDPEAIRARANELLPLELRPLVPLLNAVLEVELPETEESARIPASARATEVPRFLASAFRALTSRDPIVLFVIEDTHWLDSSSWALLEAVRMAGRSVLLLATTRPQDAPPEPFERLRADPATHYLRLQPMGVEATVEVAQQRLGIATVPPEVAALICSKAEGNPFFAEELALALRDAGLVRIENGICHVDHRLDALHFPDTIEGVVTSRIDRLTPSEQLALKVASVIGRAFHLATVRDVFPVKDARDTLPRVADHLAQLELTLHAGADQMYTFKHAVTLDVAYNLMLFEQRRSLHESVADWYELNHPDLSPFFALLAHHRCEAIKGIDRPTDAQLEKASVALVRAGTQSLDAGAKPEAIRHLQTGLELLQRLTQGSAAWCELSGWVGFAAAQLGNPEHLVAIGDAFLGVAAEGRSVSFIRALCRVVVRGLWVGEIAWADRLIAILDLPECAPLCADLATSVAVLHLRSARAFTAGDFAGALRLNSAAVTAAEAAGDPREACFQRVNLGSAFADLGLYAEAEATARDALAGAQHHGLTWVIPFVKQTLANVFAARGEHVQAKTLLREAVEELVAQGNRRVEGTARSYLAGLLVEDGQIDLAEDQARRALAATEGVAPPAYCLARMQLARALLARGQIGEAMISAQHSAELLASLGSIDEGEALVRVTYAEVLYAADDAAAARTAIEDARDRILTRAKRIDESTWRDSFLSVPENARTLRLARAWSSNST